MSGYFDYAQNVFDELIIELKGLTESEDYNETTVAEFKKALRTSQELQILIDRIDYLVSGEETEESFHQSLGDELEELDSEELFELDFN